MQNPLDRQKMLTGNINHFYFRTFAKEFEHREENFLLLHKHQLLFDYRKHGMSDSGQLHI